MSDTSLVISDRTPLLEKKESMSSIDGNHGFLTFASSDQRKKELQHLEKEYDISYAVDINGIRTTFQDADADTDESLLGSDANIACIFAVAFDARAGNIIEWHLPEDCDIDGIEFRAMASGSHKVQTDFIYFKRGGLYGLACFENMPVENTKERGARMKSVGVLATNYTSLHRHMSFLKQQVRNLLESPGSYTTMEDYYNENKATHSQFSAFKDSVDAVPNSILCQDALLLPLMKITHPAGCFSQYLKFFGEHVFALWKMVLLKKRIIFFSPPPIGVVCYRVYCTMCLSAHRISELEIPAVQPLFYINVADVELLEAEKSYIACTTEKIFESKTNLYDLYVDNQNLISEIPVIQKLLTIGPVMKLKYLQLCQQQCQMNDSSGWKIDDRSDEAWFVRFFMTLNEHLFSTLLSISRTQEKHFTHEHMQAIGLDPSIDRWFVMELAETYGIDIVMMVDNACCPT